MPRPLLLIRRERFRSLARRPVAGEAKADGLDLEVDVAVVDLVP